MMRIIRNVDHCAGLFPPTLPVVAEERSNGVIPNRVWLPVVVGVVGLTAPLAMASEDPLALPVVTQDVDPLPFAVPSRVWRLHQGAALHEELAHWAAQAGWTLVWHPAFSWRVAADAEFEGTFPEAIQGTIQALFDQGAPVRLLLWMGNSVAEVVSDERH